MHCVSRIVLQAMTTFRGTAAGHPAAEMHVHIPCWLAGLNQSCFHI